MSLRRFAFAPAFLLVACGPSADPVDAGTDAPTVALDAPEGSDAPMTPRDAGPQQVEVFAALSASTEGIALGHDASGASRIFLAQRDGHIVSVAPDRTVTDVATLDGLVGLAFREPGEIIACGDVGGVVGLYSVSLTGTVAPLTVEGPDGAYGLPNFVAIAPDDSLVFTDSMTGRVYRADADGTNVASIGDDITYPNGLAFSPDGTELYIASWDTTSLWAASFDATTGTYGTPSVLMEVPMNVDGIVPRGASELVLITTMSGGVIVDTAMPTAASASYFDRRAILVPANAVFGDATFGEDELFVSALGRPSLFIVHPPE